MKKIILLFTILIISHNGIAQLQPNEKLVYTASYNLSGLLTRFGEVSLETEQVKTDKNNYLHFTFQAATYSKWDSYFKMRDLYECYVHPYTLKPSLYIRKINEGGYSLQEKYLFNWATNTVVCTSKRNEHAEVTNTRTVSPVTQDIISSLYKLRVLNYTGFRVGKTLYLRILFDEKEHLLSIRYLGTEKIRAGILGSKDCIKLAVSTNSSALKNNSGNVIWLTNDTRRIPALIKFDVRVGSGQLELSKLN